MTRRDELQAALGPWAALREGSDYQGIPDEQWARWIEDANNIAQLAQKWFKIGIERAIDEMRSKDADGNPRWPTRNALIQHLSKIDEPN